MVCVVHPAPGQYGSHGGARVIIYYDTNWMIIRVIV